MFSRRDMLAATAVGGVVTAATMTTTNATPVKSDITFGNPNDPPQGAINAKNPRSISDPGPQNPAIRDQFPGAFSPPATDVGSMPLSWASFNNAPRRIQNGGWARQVTQDSFAVADTISGVNMRLTSGGIREMHWHQFAEWAYMTYGTCRITVLDELGRPYIADVKEGDLWYFPAGLPHSLQGLGPDGCEPALHALHPRRSKGFDADGIFGVLALRLVILPLLAQFDELVRNSTVVIGSLLLVG